MPGAFTFTSIIPGVLLGKKPYARTSQQVGRLALPEIRAISFTARLRAFSVSRSDREVRLCFVAVPPRIEVLMPISFRASHSPSIFVRRFLMDYSSFSVPRLAQDHYPPTGSALSPLPPSALL